jgi:hypothetical protein
MVLMYRQGDLLFRKVEKIPSNADVVKNGVILKGEATGHAHKLVGGTVFSQSTGFMGNGPRQMFLQVEKSGRVIHEEHRTIELEIGYYIVIRQREYNPYRISLVGD